MSDVTESLPNSQMYSHNTAQASTSSLSAGKGILACEVPLHSSSPVSASSSTNSTTVPNHYSRVSSEVFPVKRNFSHCAVIALWPAIFCILKCIPRKVDGSGIFAI